MDKSILEACRQGNLSAFEHLYRYYNLKVYHTALLIAKSREAAEDITQETFITLYKNMHMWDPSRPFEPWLYKVTINISRNYLRKHNHRGIIPWHKVQWQETQGNLKPIESMVEKVETKTLLLDSIAKLPQKIELVLILRYFHDLTQEETAKILNIPVGTVKSRIHTGLKKLRRYIDLQQFQDTTSPRKGV